MDREGWVNLESNDQFEVFYGCRTTVTYLAVTSREGETALIELTTTELDKLRDDLLKWRPVLSLGEESL